MEIVKQTIKMPESFVKLLLVTNSHLGGSRVNKCVSNYVYGTREDGVNVFDIKKVWDKYVLAARLIAGMGSKNPNVITAISSKTFGRKPVLKFSEAISCKAYTGRFVAGSFTNSNVKSNTEPHLVVVSDPIADKQAIVEASFINCPVIAFCNTDATLEYIDVCIPTNNRSAQAIGAGFFILSRLVSYIKNGMDLEEDIKNVELFFYRDAIELEQLQEEQNTKDEVSYENEDGVSETTEREGGEYSE